MKKHILICGEKGVGKSTLIRRLVEEARLTVGGFCTKMDENAEGAMRPIYIYPASLPTDQRKRGVENLVGRCGNFGRQKEIFPEVFNALGTAYLQGTPSCQVIIMDELGFMESDAHAFRRAVLQTLDGETPVLGVLREGLPGWTPAVAAHPKVRLVTVTRENRNSLPAQLNQWVQGSHLDEFI